MSSIYDIAKDVKRASKEYLKQHDKDKYINYLEEKINSLISIARDFESKYTELQNSVNKESNFEFDEMHKNILKFFVNDIKDSIKKSTLDSVFKSSLEYQIAFEELLQAKYIKYSFGTISESFYVVDGNKTVEVLKLFTKWMEGRYINESENLEI